MGGGGSKKDSDPMPSPDKYRVQLNAAKKKLGYGEKQQKAAELLQKNVRAYLNSTRRLLGANHILHKAFMAYGTSEGPEGFLVGYGYDPARDQVVKKRMNINDFRKFIGEANLYGGGEMGSTNVGDAIFTAQYMIKTTADEKALRQRELREALPRGSLKLNSKKEVDFPVFKLIMEKLCEKHYPQMGTKNSLQKACRVDIVPRCSMFARERREQCIEQFQNTTLSMLRLSKEPAKTSPKQADRMSRLAGTGKKGKYGKGGIRATKRTAIQ